MNRILSFKPNAREGVVDVSWADGADVRRLASWERPDKDLTQALEDFATEVSTFIGVELALLKAVTFPSTDSPHDISIRVVGSMHATNGSLVRVTTDKIEYVERLTNKETGETAMVGKNDAPLALLERAQELQRELVLYIDGKRAQKELAFPSPSESAR